MAESFKAPALPADVNHGVGPKTPIIPVAITGIGLYLAWFGVHYWMSDVKWPSDPIKALLTGKPMPDNTKASPTAATAGPQLAFIPSTPTDAIGKSAMKYLGAGYVWGGNASKPGEWDCSSFVSKVLGEDLGLPLPGGGRWGDAGYPPNAHGPGSTAYMLYGTGIEHAQVQSGDLIVSVEHIGIAISPTQMISAQSPSSGTAIGDFPAGFPAGPPVYRRVSTQPLYFQR